jgi:hypothetical protein
MKIERFRAHFIFKPSQLGGARFARASPNCESIAETTAAERSTRQ